VDAKPTQDRLKIGASENDSQEKASVENFVANEKLLEESRAKVAELEKNIAELQKLIDESKGVKPAEKVSLFGEFGPVFIALCLITFAAILIWLLARNARRLEPYSHPAQHSREDKKVNQPLPTVTEVAAIEEVQIISSEHLPMESDRELEALEKVEATEIPEEPILAQEVAIQEPSTDLTQEESVEPAPTIISRQVPERAKSLFKSINLDLTAPVVPAPQSATILDETLRVKLNLARAYITIEDYAAAKKSLDLIVAANNSADPSITSEAQGLLAEIAQRHA